MIAGWVRYYVGIPFVDRGRGHDMGGLDCWGLVRLVEREVFGVRLPSLSDEYESCSDCGTLARLVNAQRPLIRARSVDAPLIGDLVLLRLRGLLCHVGVCVGDGHMLHTRPGTMSVVEDLASPKWARRVEGYYRVS